jgi:hypothetical protein
MSVLIVILVLIVVVLALGYGLYTRRGSGIDVHPGPDSGDPVIGDPTKHESIPGDKRGGGDRAENPELDQRGTK